MADLDLIIRVTGDNEKSVGVCCLLSTDATLLGPLSVLPLWTGAIACSMKETRISITISTYVQSEEWYVILCQKPKKHF